LTNAVTGAKPPLAFIPATFNPWVRQGVKALLPFWLRTKTNVAQIEATQVETLVQLFDEFQAGKVRFMIAFRHPAPEDAYALAQLLWQKVPQAARKQGIRFKSPIHGHFIYDRGIPLWAGEWVAWLYSQLGGTSIQRGKLDLAALKAARALFCDGQFPMVASPEGGNNGHNEIVSPLEPGIAQLGFWCAEDLKKAGRSERVAIVPLGIQYRYLSAPWTAVENLLAELENANGLSHYAEPAQLAALPTLPDMGLTPQKAQELYARLIRLAEHVLTLMESYYRKFYQVSLNTTTAEEAATMSANERLQQRLTALLNAALQVAETYFGLTPKGSLIDRCRRLEQAGWERIFREDIDITNLSAVERGLADRLAEEADLRMWHMRLVESFVAVTGRYVLEKPTVERFAETVLLMHDMISRIQGKNPFPRPQLGPQQILLTVGEPISVSDRLEAYKTSRRQAVDELTQTLQTTLTDLIVTTV
jgi:hypothetical protein